MKLNFPEWVSEKLYDCKAFKAQEMIDNFFGLSFEQILILKFSLLVQNSESLELRKVKH
jgi:hypothetical protein